MRRQLGVPRRFERVQEVLRFVGLTVGGAIIAPTVALLPLAHHLSDGGCGPGVELVDLVAGRRLRHADLHAADPQLERPGHRVLDAAARLEAIVFALLLVVATEIVFSAGFGRSFVLLPFIIWAAFRFGQREVTTASALLCGMALWYTLGGEVGPFASVPLNESLLLAAGASSARWWSPA